MLVNDSDWELLVWEEASFGLLVFVQKLSDVPLFLLPAGRVRLQNFAEGHYSIYFNIAWRMIVCTPAKAFLDRRGKKKIG